MEPHVNERASADTGELVKALVLAQAGIKAPQKKSSGQARGGTYLYADLAAIMDSIREPMAKQGLAYTQIPEVRADRFLLVTRIMHVSG